MQIVNEVANKTDASEIFETMGQFYFKIQEKKLAESIPVLRFDQKQPIFFIVFAVADFEIAESAVQLEQKNSPTVF